MVAIPRTRSLGSRSGDMMVELYRLVTQPFTGDSARLLFQWVLRTKVQSWRVAPALSVFV